MDIRAGTYLARTAKLPFRAAMNESPRAMVIVETRPLYFLPHVVAAAVQNNPGWNLYVFGSPEVHALLDRHCENYGQVNRVLLEVPGGRMGVGQYSRLLTSRRFWEVVREEHEHLLVFQADSVVVRPVPDWCLAYDYVGAVCGSDDPADFIMNGGLSVRRRSAMLRALAAVGEPTEEAEDVAFCRAMRLPATAAQFALPSREQCMAFAVESAGDPDAAVGMHGAGKGYAPPALVARLLSVPLDPVIASPPVAG
jgi:hypothetical protein